MQKDSEGTGDIVMDDNQSGWVPAGESVRDSGEPHYLSFTMCWISRLPVGDESTDRASIEPYRWRYGSSSETTHPTLIHRIELVPGYRAHAVRCQGR